MEKKLFEIPCPNCSASITFLEIKGYVMSPVICQECYALLNIRDVLGEWILEINGVINVQKLRVPR